MKILTLQLIFITISFCPTDSFGHQQEVKFQQTKLTKQRKKNLSQLELFLENLHKQDSGQKIKITENPNIELDTIAKASCANGKVCRMIIEETHTRINPHEFCIEKNQAEIHDSFRELTFVTNHKILPLMALKISDDMTIKNHGFVNIKEIKEESLTYICQSNGYQTINDFKIIKANNLTCSLPVNYKITERMIIPIKGRSDNHDIIDIKCQEPLNMTLNGLWTPWSPWTRCTKPFGAIRWRKCLGEPNQRCNMKGMRNQIQLGSCNKVRLKQLCGIGKWIQPVVATPTSIINRTPIKSVYTDQKPTLETCRTKCGRKRVRTPRIRIHYEQTTDKEVNTTTETTTITYNALTTITYNALTTPSTIIENDNTTNFNNISTDLIQKTTTWRSNNTMTKQTTTTMRMITKSTKVTTGHRYDTIPYTNNSSYTTYAYDIANTKKPTTNKSETRKNDSQPNHVNQVMPNTTKSWIQTTKTVTMLDHKETTTNDPNMMLSHQPTKHLVWHSNTVMNYLETIGFCNELGTQMISKDDWTNIKRTNLTSSWFWIDAYKKDKSWLWKSGENIDIPWHGNKTEDISAVAPLAKIPEDAENCLIANTQNIGIIPCIWKIKPLCSTKKANKPTRVIDYYKDFIRRNRNDNCKYNYRQRSFRCNNWHSNTITKDLRNAKIIGKRKITLDPALLPLSKNLKTIKEEIFSDTETEILATIVFLPCINEEWIAYEHEGRTEMAAIIMTSLIKKKCTFPLTFRRKLLWLRTIEYLKKSCVSITCIDFMNKENRMISKLMTIKKEYETQILKRLIPKLMKTSWKRMGTLDQLLVSLINLHTETYTEELDEQTRNQIDEAIREHKTHTIAYTAINIIADIVKKQKRETENDE